MKPNVDPIVICLMGPTASGKTAMACQLVQEFPCEIVSVDSAMIYRGMNVGTAKPDAALLARAPHRLIDIVDPIDTYSVAQFCTDAQICCDDIIQRGKIPLLVGGTMMYYRALQQGLSVLPEADASIRDTLLDLATKHGWTYVHQKLMEVDPLAGSRIHPNDTQRIQRALEVFYLTGQSLTSLQQQNRVSAYRYINCSLMPNSRAWLHDRIALRFKEMMSQGFVEEVINLLQRWDLNATHPSMRCVGYRQVYEHLLHGSDLDSLNDKGIAATRQLAKRQLTWLRHWPDSYVFAADQDEVLNEIIIYLSDFLRKSF